MLLDHIRSLIDPLQGNQWARIAILSSAILKGLRYELIFAQGDIIGHHLIRLFLHRLSRHSRLLDQEDEQDRIEDDFDS